MDAAKPALDRSRFLETILCCIQQGILVADMEGRILFVSPAIEKIFGYSPEELLMKDLSDLFLPDDIVFLYPNLLTLCRAGETFEGQIMLRRREGTGFYCLMSLKACEQGLEHGPVLLACITDIDRSKRLEQTLKDAQYEDLVKIASGVAHELRNPLMSIGGFVSRLYRSCRSVDHHDQYYDYILTNLRKIERLVKKVEAFARLPRPTFRKVSIAEIVQRALDPLWPSFREREIDVSVDMGDVSLLMDPEMILRVFSILLENALDALPHRGRVAIEGGVENRSFDVRMQDTGAGIMPEDLPFIFNPFFSTKADGAGIDLATAKRIVEIHSGTIRAASERGKGTTFFLTFPLERRQTLRIAHLGKA